MLERYVCFALVALWTSVASATETKPSAEEGSNDRKLAGYTFVAPMLGDSAFPTTHVGIRQGFAYAQVENFYAPSTHAFTLQTTGLVDDLELGWKINRHIGVYGTLSGQLTSGLNGQSVVVAGSSYQLAVLGGVVVPIAHIEKTGTFVSARAFVGYGSGEGIELLPLARSLTNDLKTADLVHAASTVLNANLFPTTFVPSSYTKGGGSLNVAQTIKPFLALQASVSVSAVSQSGTQTDRTIGSSVAVDALEGRESVSAAASFDAGPLGFPVATMAEYSLSSGRLRPSPPGSTELAHLVAFGIYYSGSRTLQMGLGAATQVRMMQVLVYDEAGKPRASDRPLFLLGQILLRHDF